PIRRTVPRAAIKTADVVTNSRWPRFEPPGRIVNVGLNVWPSPPCGVRSGTAAVVAIVEVCRQSRIEGNARGAFPVGVVFKLLGYVDCGDHASTLSFPFRKNSIDDQRPAISCLRIMRSAGCAFV